MFPEIEQIRQLLDLLRFLADNWWIIAAAAGLILLVFLVKNAKAILQTLAIACGIGVVLVVAAALFSESAPVIVPSVPTAVPSAPAASSNPLSLLATGACSGAALVIAAVIGGAYLYHRWFRANQNRKQGGQWLPGPNALWGREQQPQPPPYVLPSAPYYAPYPPPLPPNYYLPAGYCPPAGYPPQYPMLAAPEGDEGEWWAWFEG